MQQIWDRIDAIRSSALPLLARSEQREATEPDRSMCTHTGDRATNARKAAWTEEEKIRKYNGASTGSPAGPSG